MSVVHNFTSAKSDGGDATLVKPSDWNANHTLTGISRHRISTVGTTGFNLYHNLGTYSCLVGWSTTWNTGVYVDRVGLTHTGIIFTSESVTVSDIFISNLEVIF